MKITARIKDLGEKGEFRFDASDLVEEISKACPVINELFPEKKSFGGPAWYKIKLNERNKKKLQELMSQIDKYRLNINTRDYDSLQEDYIWSFKRLAHLSMIKKKNIEVICSN